MYELPVLQPSAAPSPPLLPTAGVKVRFGVEGMHCASCVGRAEAGLLAIPGVTAAHVNLATREAQVVLHVGTAEPDWRPVLSALGYQYRALEGGAPPEEQAAPWNWVAALLLASLVMGISMGGVQFPGAQGLMVVASAGVVFGLGRGFFTTAWSGLRQRTTDMNTLIALGAGVAFIAGLVELGNAGAGHGHSAAMPFDAATMIVAFVLLGRWLESRARQQASGAIDELGRLVPREAVVLRQLQEVTVPLEAVVRGDRVLVRPGSRVPVDGQIESGAADLDESLLTGESLPVHRQVGDLVLGGSLCHGGSFIMQAQQVGDATTLRQIIRLVHDAQGTKAPIARLADRAARIFVPTILVLAVLTGLAWLLLASGPGRGAMALQSAVNVLVIACPCALGLATPVAVMVAMGRAARCGLLIRDGAALETLGRVTRIAFDKTGTLTLGQPRVVQFEGELPDPAGTLSAVRAVARLSEHPLSQAIVRWVDQKIGADAAPALVTEFQSTAGRGIRGRCQGQFIELSRDESATTDQPGTRTVLEINGVALGTWTLEDTVRPEATDVLSRLHTQGLTTALLTGDREAVARPLAVQLGIDAIHSGLYPSDKGTIIQQWQSQGVIVAMVGDGINDAPALAIADVGIALGSGTEVAIATADVTVLAGTLRGVETALALSRRTLQIIRQNLVFAFGYNLLGIPLAAGLLYPWTGWLLPSWFAAAAMSASSVCVVLNSLRIGRFRTDA